MRANNRVGREPFDLRVELARAEFLSRTLELADTGVSAWPIRFRIQERPQLRQSLHQLDVLLAVEFLEIFRHERQQIEVRGGERWMRKFRGGLDRLRRAHVASASGNTEDQQYLRHARY